MIIIPDDLTLTARITRWGAGSKRFFDLPLLPTDRGTLASGRDNPSGQYRQTTACCLGTDHWQVSVSFEPISADKLGQLDIAASSPLIPDDIPLIAFSGQLEFTLLAGSGNQITLELLLIHNSWSSGHYLMLPAAAYSGNRFRALEIPSTPMVQPEQGAAPDMELTMTDVPRLEHGSGWSAIELKCADLATPLIGWQEKPRAKSIVMPMSASASGRSVFLISKENNQLGSLGLTVTESADRSQACFSIRAPAKREHYRYKMASTRQPSDDRAADIPLNQKITIDFQFFVFASADIPAFFRQFSLIRKQMPAQRSWPDRLPFSQALDLIISQHNRENWREREGYYRLSPGESPFSYWQAGWCGGGMNSYPMLFSPAQINRERSIRNMQYIFDQMQLASGYFISIAMPNRLFGDDFQHPENTRIVLLRKMTDLVYFLLKHLIWLRDEDEQDSLTQRYSEHIHRSCQALVDLWRKEGQWGQFIDNQDNRVLLGGTAGPASGLAALALASSYFNEAVFLDTACEIGLDYYQRFTRQGLTNGGPGEIAQCPDSESAFALLEGYVLLAETTGDPAWSKRALEAAHQCASWCVSYDFQFPESSEFGRLDMRTTGSVYANVQNKHSAPGICTFSGDALLKLYRLTDDLFCLDLLRDIAHNLMQYLSRDDRPVLSWDQPPIRLSSGTMSERVNMSDWEGDDKVGGVFNGQCWCSVSAMLTAIEVPGIYYRRDTELLWTADHVKATIKHENDGSRRLHLDNLTDFDARVRLLIDNEQTIRKALGSHAVLRCPVIFVPAGQSTDYLIN